MLFRTVKQFNNEVKEVFDYSLCNEGKYFEEQSTLEKDENRFI